jgi:hypothetical protein
LERALRQSWPVTEAMKAKALKRALETLNDKESHPRSIAAATRAVISATQVNLAVVDTAIRAKQSEDFDERLKALEAQQETDADESA